MRRNYRIVIGAKVTLWKMIVYQISSIQSLSRVRPFATPWTAARQASLSITNSQSSPKRMSSGRWCHPTVSASVVPLSCLQSFPASGSFPRFCASGGQSIGVSASASVLPMINSLYYIPWCEVEGRWCFASLIHVISIYWSWWRQRLDLEMVQVNFLMFSKICFLWAFPVFSSSSLSKHAWSMFELFLFKWIM